MKITRRRIRNSALLLAGLCLAPAFAQEIVTFPSGNLLLHGVVYKPVGTGPFPAVVFNHGSGKDYAKQFDAVGPLYASRGFVLFAPYRRGQGLSSDAGANILELLDKEAAANGTAARGKLMVKLLETDHLDDQLAALAWLEKQKYVNPRKIAVAGNSFGGIEVLLAAERTTTYCAAIDSAGAALTWADSPAIRERLVRAVKNAKIPIFLFQAENDKDLSPSKTLAAELGALNKPHRLKLYPPFGKTTDDGHSFGYYGGEHWIGDVVEFIDRACRR